MTLFLAQFSIEDLRHSPGRPAVLGWCAQLPGRRAGGAVRLGGRSLLPSDLLRNEAVLAKGAFPEPKPEDTQ